MSKDIDNQMGLLMNMEFRKWLLRDCINCKDQQKKQTSMNIIKLKTIKSICASDDQNHTKNDIEKESNQYLDDNFDIDDIESLQEASIDNELLENHFLNHESKEETFKKQFLTKYARTYGYFVVSKEDLFVKKL